MTAIPKDPRVSELREMFRYLVQFRTLHETDGVDEVLSSYGNPWSLWDLEYLYAQTERLTDAQRRAITLCLVHGMLEREAAKAMGVGETNPVGMYATLGLRRLLDMIDRGELTRFREGARCGPPAPEREAYNDGLAAFIRSQIALTSEGCWRFPHAPGREPTVLVRCASTASGFLPLHPRVVLFERDFGRLGDGLHLVHAQEGPDDCVNPRHAKSALTPAKRAALRAHLRKEVSA